MALRVFNPTEPPHANTSVSFKPKLLETEFGNGYSQVAAAGINHIKKDARMVWNNIHADDAAEIITFFEDHGGYEPFLYRFPGDPLRTRVRCTEWNLTYISQPQRRAINATFVKDYSLAT